MSGRREMLQREYVRRRARYIDGARPARPPRKPRKRGCLPWVLVVLALAALAILCSMLVGRKDLPEVPPALRQAVSAIAPIGDSADAYRGPLAAYLCPPESEMTQLYQFIANSPYVQENSQYARIVNGIPFVYDEGDDAVNASAGKRKVETRDGTEWVRTLTLQGGLVRYSRLLGLAAALEASQPGILKRTVENLPPDLLSKASLEATGEFAVRQGLVAALGDETARHVAHSFSSGMLMGVLAHETGHHALGHLDFNRPVADDIQRDKEMQADSFASAILKSSPASSEYMLMGQILFWYALSTQTGEEEGDLNSGSHPLSRWRLETLIRQNEQLAAELGISVD